MKHTKILLILLTSVLVACHSKEGLKHKHQNHQETPHHHNDLHHKDLHHKGNEINKHMHNTPVSELIKRFESPEREQYQQPEKVLDYIGDIKGQTILDIGAGSGYFSVKMVTRGATVIAGDVNDEFLNYMKTRIKKENIDPLKMIVRKLPYDSPALNNQEVNKAIIVNTYHHIEDRISYFSKVLQGLTIGGELIVIDFFKRELPIGPGVNHKFSEEEVVAELKKAGYSKFSIESDLLELQYIIRARE